MAIDGTDSRSLTALVQGLYRALLLREPDEVGLRQTVEFYDAHLEAGGPIDTLLIAFLTSAEFGAALPRFIGRYAGTAHSQLTLDQSQHGELELLLRLMVNRDAAHQVVVDVGANGRERSNSYDLLRFFGWKGLLIEANPFLIDKIKKEFAGLDATVINTAIADREGTATLHLGINDDVSSLTEQNAKNWGETRGVVDVPVVRLSSLLAANDVPTDFDLLSIDAEGEDVAILNEAVAAGYCPRWVVIEASFGFTTKDLNALPFSAAVRETYGIVAQTRANLILGHTQDVARLVPDGDVLKSLR